MFIYHMLKYMAKNGFEIINKLDYGSQDEGPAQRDQTIPIFFPT